jgi:hypothetical protein
MPSAGCGWREAAWGSVRGVSEMRNEGRRTGEEGRESQRVREGEEDEAH